MASPGKEKAPEPPVKGSARQAKRTLSAAASSRRTAGPKRAGKAAAAAAGGSAGAQAAPELEDLILAWEEPAAVVDSSGEIVIEDPLTGAPISGRSDNDPVLAGGDPDARVTETGGGEEAVGGSDPTPDQGDPDAIGRALGVTYAGEETLELGEKIEKRDAERWELHPASSEDFDERQRQLRARGSGTGPRVRGTATKRRSR